MAKTFRMMSTRDRERRLREVFAALPADGPDLGDLICRMSEFVMTLLGNGTPAGADFAADLYKLACKTWHRNRVEEYGYDNLSDPLERATVDAHREVFDALVGAEAIAEGAAAAGDPWAELGDEWARFVAAEGGAR